MATMKSILSWTPWTLRISPAPASGPAWTAHDDVTGAELCRSESGHFLAKGELLTLRGRSAVTLECVSGRLWVTDGGSRGDIILQSGDTMDIICCSHTIVEALADSVLTAA